MELNEVRFGAHYLARRMRVNPRELIIKVLEEHEGENKEEQFEHFREMIKGSDEYQRAVDWYFFTNMHDYVTTNRSSSSRRDHTEEIKQGVADLKAKVMKTVLTLQFIMPNGKSIAECTGSEVMGFGGLFTAIGRKAGKKLIGEVFTSDKRLRSAAA